MSNKEVKIDELSEGQLLLRSWWEEEGPHYHMCYTDRQYQRKAREEHYKFIPPTFSDNEQDIQRNEFYQWFIGYTPDPRDTYFTCLFAAAQYLK